MIPSKKKLIPKKVPIQIIIQQKHNMIQNEGVILRSLIVFINLISILGCAAILWTFHKVPKFNQNPGTIVKRISVLQLLVQTLLMFSQFYDLPTNPTLNNFAFQISDGWCSTVGFFTVFTNTLYNCYNVQLIVCVTMILQQKGDKFNQIFRKVDVATWIICLTLTLSLLINKESKTFYLIGECIPNEGRILQVVFDIFGTLLLTVSGIFIFCLCFKIKSIQINQAIYDQDIDVFQRKHLKEYTFVNILYSLVFILIRLLPCFYLFVKFLTTSDTGYQAIKRQTQYFFLFTTSLGGLFLFVIRSQEPVVKKYLVKLWKNKRDSKKLKNRLNPRQSIKSSDISEKLLRKDSLEITMYQETSRSTTSELIVPKLLHANSKKLENSYSIKSVGELAQIMVVINHIMEESESVVKSNISYSKRELRPYAFSYIIRREIYIKQTHKELELLIKNQRNQPKIDYNVQINNSDADESSLFPHQQDFIDTEYEQGSQSHPSKSRLQVFTYGQDILNNFLQSAFQIPQRNLQQSLDIFNNIQRLQETRLENLNRFGTIFITWDGLLSLELITTDQKSRLIRGQGLMRLNQRWKDAQMTQEEEVFSQTILPSIIGLHSIQLDPKRFVNIVVRLNSIRVDYPLTEKNWENKNLWYDKFVKKNIIGWITLSADSITKRFIATSVTDGKFRIELSKPDFKMVEEAQIRLIEILSKDLPILLSFAAGLEINFVYYKFSTQRLFSIYQHEQNNDKISENILRSPNSESDLSLMCQQGKRKFVGKFPLDTKLGYVKVFFEELWTKHDLLGEEEIAQSVERIITSIHEMI